MTSRHKKKSKPMKGKVKIDDILRRVDRLPVLDSRTADEIVGYDGNGLPQSEDPKRAAEPTFRKPKRIPQAVQDFLKYRHRDWDK